MTTVLAKAVLSVGIVVACALFFPIVLFFAVFDAVKLCAWILRDIMVNLWSGEWR
mgnify:CR=1 FL=1